MYNLTTKVVSPSTPEKASPGDPNEPVLTNPSCLGRNCSINVDNAGIYPSGTLINFTSTGATLDTDSVEQNMPTNSSDTVAVVYTAAGSSNLTAKAKVDSKESAESNSVTLGPESLGTISLSASNSTTPNKSYDVSAEIELTGVIKDITNNKTCYLEVTDGNLGASTVEKEINCMGASQTYSFAPSNNAYTINAKAVADGQGTVNTTSSQSVTVNLANPVVTVPNCTDSEVLIDCRATGQPSTGGSGETADIGGSWTYGYLWTNISETNAARIAGGDNAGVSYQYDSTPFISGTSGYKLEGVVRQSASIIVTSPSTVTGTWPAPTTP